MLLLTKRFLLFAAGILLMVGCQSMPRVESEAPMGVDWSSLEANIRSGGVEASSSDPLQKHAQVVQLLRSANWSALPPAERRGTAEIRLLELLFEQMARQIGTKTKGPLHQADELAIIRDVAGIDRGIWLEVFGPHLSPPEGQRSRNESSAIASGVLKAVDVTYVNEVGLQPAIGLLVNRADSTDVLFEPSFDVVLQWFFTASSEEGIGTFWQLSRMEARYDRKAIENSAETRMASAMVASRLTAASVERRLNRKIPDLRLRAIDPPSVTAEASQQVEAWFDDDFYSSLDLLIIQGQRPGAAYGMYLLYNHRRFGLDRDRLLDALRQNATPYAERRLVDIYAAKRNP